MNGDPPTGLYLLAYELKKTVKEVEAMDPDERLGWEAFLTVKPVLEDLAARTAASRARTR
jgi:hypothetical protein